MGIAGLSAALLLAAKHAHAVSDLYFQGTAIVELSAGLGCALTPDALPGSQHPGLICGCTPGFTTIWHFRSHDHLAAGAQSEEEEGCEGRIHTAGGQAAQWR